MHPPWITFRFFIMLLSVSNGTLQKIKPEKEQIHNNGSENLKIEAKERERRLIPYMTYYVARNYASINSPSQNSFQPIYQPQGRILHLTSTPRISPENSEKLIAPIQKETHKSSNSIKTPIFITSPETILGNQERSKAVDVPILRQIYKVEPLEILRPQFQPQSPSQSAHGSNPPAEIIGAPVRQNLETPPFIKIIPIIPRLSLGNRQWMIYNPAQALHSYAASNISPQPSVPFKLRDQTEPRITISPNTKNSKAESQGYISAVSLHSFPNRILYGSIAEKNKEAQSNLNIPSTPSSLLYSTETTLNFERTLKPASGNVLIHLIPQNPLSKISSLPLLHHNEEIKNPQKGKIHEASSSNLKKIEVHPRLRVPLEEDIKFVAGVTPVSISNDLRNLPQVLEYDNNQERTLHLYKQPVLDNLLSIIRETNNLPQNFTSSVMNTGIKTLASIFERLQQNYSKANINSSPTRSRINLKENPDNLESQNPKKVHSFPQPSGTSTPGKPGIDYPIYSSIPPTKFDCSTQRYKGFFGDPDTKCQVWHYCDLNGGQASFLCPNGTIFSQVALTCDWWFNVKCASTSQLYVLNERLYKYILPFSPSFPEDYSGPVVDTYLAAKFKEMEAKSKSKALKSPTSTMNPEYVGEVAIEPYESTISAKESKQEK